jgi:hypothetical protein
MHDFGVGTVNSQSQAVQYYLNIELYRRISECLYACVTKWHAPHAKPKVCIPACLPVRRMQIGLQHDCQYGKSDSMAPLGAQMTSFQVVVWHGEQVQMFSYILTKRSVHTREVYAV